MINKYKIKNIFDILLKDKSDNKEELRLRDASSQINNAKKFVREYIDTGSVITSESESTNENPLWTYFQENIDGPGIWKWNHYFDVYDRYFAKFVGSKVNVMEIGIFSGGSLQMWRSYFGNDSHIYGVDIEDACRAYQNEYTTILIGDQEDHLFWQRLKKQVKKIDIIIDDGGHTPEQQQCTLEELLPHLRPGGVYVCEDIHGSGNKFTDYCMALVHELNSVNLKPGKELKSAATRFQSYIYSIHFYPFLMVIEKQYVPPDQFCAPKHGSEWQPFFETSSNETKANS